ncbi:helix-turn-helix domain-containing protein [Methylorubrum extorquens]
METLNFRSRDYADGLAFEAYRDLYSGGSEVTPLGTPFAASVRGIRFPQLLLFDRTLQGVSHERTRRRVGVDAFEHLMLQLVVEGRMMVQAGNVAQVVEAGNLVLFDLTQPQRTWTTSARIITVAVARTVVVGTLPVATNLHGTVLPRSGSELLQDFLLSLARNGGRTSAPLAAAATTTAGALLLATLGGEAAAREDAPLVGMARVNLILDFIDANLIQPDLTPETIAVRTGISRTALYRLLEPLGGVAAQVQKRRLRAMRLALARRSDGRSIGEIAAACGFVSASHASRSFRARFGLTPREFREANAQAAEAGGGVSTDAVLQRWFDEVR